MTIVGLFHLYEDISAFKDHLRDFLVEIKVINGFVKIAYMCTVALTKF